MVPVLIILFLLEVALGYFYGATEATGVAIGVTFFVIFLYMKLTESRFWRT